MGKGVIISHLGDAHYRIGLDIDVSYARNQLLAIQTYLDEFAPKYQEATEAKDAAKAALTPINDRLTDYLAAGQAAGQAAYDAMVAAYEDYADAVQNLPDQEMVQAAQDDADEVSGEFAGNPNEETALDTLAADSLWQSVVGDFLDVAAVQAATDAKNAAISDLVTAQQEFDLGNIPEEALTWYQQNYATLRGDWLTVVSENSGPARVSTLEGQWQAATEAFDTARKDLGKLLGSGGLPEELAAILSDQEKAYADYHAALANWQSMTLVKAEKETLRAELQSRLLPYTDNDGEPVRQEVNAWCCDATEDLSPGAEVATIEIPGERDLAVRVRPGYESRETYAAERDGLLQPSWASSPEATYWNWALHPGNARWNPNYRLGEILLIDPQAGTCTVRLDQQTNNAKSRARDGNVLDVNNPIKYQIDPDTGEQTTILPGDNVIVDGGITTLTDVPIEYMECNADAFEVGDHVMVEFQGRDWTQPKVIGFPENPKPCGFRGIVFSASGVDSQVQIKEGIETFSHPKSTLSGGNYDWISTDRKTCLTWNGPPGRAIRNRIEPVTVAVGEPGFSASTTHGSIRQLSYIDPATYRGARYYAIDDAGPYVWRDGRVFGQAPAGHAVLGAAIIRHVDTDEQGVETRHTYAALASRPSLSGFADLWDDAAPHTVSLWWARVTGADAILPADWTLFHAENLMPHDALPMLGCVNFSGSGLKFAALSPTRVLYEYVLEFAPNTGRLSAGLGNDVIVTGEITASAEGLSLASITVTPQIHDPATVGGTYTTTTEPVDSTHVLISRSASFARNQVDIAIVAMDWIGEELAQMSGAFSLAHSSQNDMSYLASITEDSQDNIQATNGATVSVDFTLTDEHRSKTLQVWTINASQSGSAANDGTTIYGGTNTASDSLSMVRPLYYDLRTGAAVYETGTASTSISSGGGVVGGVPAYTSTCTLELSKQISSLAPGSDPYWETSRSVTATDTDTGWIFAAIDWVYLASDFRRFPIGDQAGGGACHYAAYPWLQQWTIKSGSVGGITYVDRYAKYGNFSSLALQLGYMPYFPDWQTRETYYNWAANVTKSITTLPAYSQPGPVIGDLVTRITSIQSTPDMDNWTVHFAAKDERNTVFATGFDVDQAWQDHIDTAHPPAEGEEPITQTALEANLKPLFRR